MMPKVSAHDGDKVSHCELKSMGVYSSETQLPRRRFENTISSIKED